MNKTPQPSEAYISKQMRKRHLAAVWAGLAGLKEGHVVLDIGSGPGFLAVAYARIVGAAGVVYAVDPGAALVVSAPNLVGLAALPVPRPPDVVFLTDTLHHAADAAGLLAAVRAACEPGTRLLVTDYDPAGPGTVGAKPARRMDRETAAKLISNSGFDITFSGPAPDEHYAVLARG